MTKPRRERTRERKSAVPEYYVNDSDGLGVVPNIKTLGMGTRERGADVKPHATKTETTAARLIACLLNGESIPDAAKTCGISRSTAWRMSREASFQIALNSARQATVERAELRLEQLARTAVDALGELVGDIDPSIKLRAATGILDRLAIGDARLEQRVRDALHEQIEATTGALRELPAETFDAVRGVLERAAGSPGRAYVLVEVDENEEVDE
jgi:hypothetical protein